MTNTRRKQHKRPTKEAPPWNSQQRYSTGGPKLASQRANSTLRRDVDQDTQMLGPHERPLTHPCTISLNTQTKTQKGDKAKTRTQQHIKPNNGAKHIQQATPMGLTTAKAPAPPPFIPLTDTSLSQNSHRVRNPTHQRAIRGKQSCQS